MKPRQLLAVVALTGAAGAFSAGCDNDEAADDAYGSGGYQASGEVTDDGNGMDAAADASEELDSGPIPEEQFDQLKELWSGQILVIEGSAKTLATINEEHKDESLARMIEELQTKSAAMRKGLDEATRTSRRFLQVELPASMEEAGALLARAQERMQQVVAAKAGIPQ